MYYLFDMPEISATEAPLGDIIVQPYDADVLQANGGLSVNFGQGRLATATEVPNYFNGFNRIASLPNILILLLFSI